MRNSVGQWKLVWAGGSGNPLARRAIGFKT